MSGWRSRSILALGVLAGCNRIFGFDDTAQLADGPSFDSAPAIYRTCIDDHFDQLDPMTWTKSTIPNITVDAIGGELAIEGVAQVIGNAGIASVRHGFRGGVVDVEVTDSITQDLVRATLEVELENGTSVAITKTHLSTDATFVVSGNFRFTSRMIDHRYWRVRHDELTEVLFLETSADATTFEELGFELSVNAEVAASASVILSAEFTAPGGADRVAFDNLKLQGFCPP